jgi:DMSO/TMAO reductase YedYZ molybdopterin-dependent catalytic subunit
MADSQPNQDGTNNEHASAGEASAPAHQRVSESKAPPEDPPQEMHETEAEPPPPAPAFPVLGDKEVARLSRRELLKLTPLVLAGAFAIPKLREFLLDRGVAASDKASGALFRRAHLAPTFPDSMLVPFDNFPYNGYDVIDPEVDLENWTLTVEGQVANPGEFTLEQIQRLPKVVQNTRHVCVEGWDAIGSFGGARISDFLRLVGADMRARFVEVKCADDYYESMDMESVLHPQSLLCYEMYGKPLDRGHGAPLGLRMPTKLGYKQAKYLTTLRVTNVLRPDKRGYWEDQGYSWHGGL